MNTPLTPPTRVRQHPLLILAAIAVILFSLVGTAAIMGWLPSSHGSRNNLTDADRAALAAGMQQPGQPGYVPPPAVATAPAETYPVQPATPAQAGYGAQGFVPANGANGAYGYSGSQGASGSGGPDVAYVPESRPRVVEHTTQRTASVADEDRTSRWCASCGNVESVRAITTRARGSGVGAGAGAILGGLLGNQLGGGHGRQLATVAGAVGGAVVGNQVEGNMKASHSYEIRVRLDDGTLRTFHQHSTPQWRTGDRVRIVKGSLHTA